MNVVSEIRKFFKKGLKNMYIEYTLGRRGGKISEEEVENYPSLLG